MEEYENDYDLVIPVPNEDDVTQEASIFEWQNGKKANKAIIRQNLTNQMGGTTWSFGNYDQSCLAEASDPWAPTTKVAPDVIQYIVEFALGQSEYIKGLIFDFLEDSTESKLNHLMETLSFYGLVTAEIEECKPQQRSMAEIIRNSLPLTKDEIIILVSRVSPQTKRPAATARQFIRDNLNRGWIYIDDEGMIYDNR